MDTAELITHISGALSRRAPGVIVTSLQLEEALAVVARAAGLEHHVSGVLASNNGMPFVFPDEDEVGPPDKIDTELARLELLCSGCFGGTSPVGMWLISSPKPGHMQFDLQCTHTACNERHLLIDLDRFRSRNDDVKSVDVSLTWEELLTDEGWPVRLGEVDGGHVRYTALLPLSVDEVAERIGRSFERHVDLCLRSLRKTKAMAKG